MRGNRRLGVFYLGETVCGRSRAEVATIVIRRNSVEETGVRNMRSRNINAPAIMVPLDGSKFAECALPLAINVARELNGRIGLVSVSQKKANGRRQKAGTNSAEKLDDVDLKRANYLKITAMRVERASSVHVDRIVFRGPAGKALVKYSTIHHPELIVMSTHGRGPLSRAWLGSVADWVVRHASMPVLLVRPRDEVEVDLTERSGLGNILVALDGSSQAEESLKWARAIGGDSAAYTLVRVVRNSMPVWSVDPTCGSFDYRDYAKHASIKVSEYLMRVERLMNNGSRNVCSVAAESMPAAVGILKTAEERASDLITITTHGRGGLPRLLLGSVADKVVRASNVPVLVVRPKRA